MKIRTDFVTNSSSSGFILIQLTYRNGKETYIEPEWDSGWGDYFSSYGMDDMLYAAKTGEDLLNILQDRISNWKSLVEDKSWTASFRKEIQDLPSLDVVKSIHIEEHCYDDPDMKDKEYTYEFTDVSSYKVIVAGKHCDLFDVPQKTEPTFSANCGYYGIFSGDAVQKLQKHGWCFGNELKKEAEYKIEWEPNSRKLTHPFYIVGDVTTVKLDSGKLNSEYKMLKRYKERFGFKLYSESDFMALGSRPIPNLPDVQLSSIEGLNVCCVGSFRQSHSSLRKSITAYGGIFQKGRPTLATDVVVISDDIMTHEDLEYGRYSESLAKDLDRFWGKYKKSRKPLMVTESQFTALGFITQKGDTGRKTLSDVSDKINSRFAELDQYYDKDSTVVFEGKTFVFTGMGYRGDVPETDPVVSRVIRRGGIFSQKVSSETDCLIVGTYRVENSDVESAVKQKKNGKGIKIIRLEDLERVLKKPVSTSIADTDPIKMSQDEILRMKNKADRNGFLIIGDTLCRYFGNKKDIVVPSGIKRIHQEAFVGCDKIESVVLPEGLEYIGKGAFKGWLMTGGNSIASIQFPSSLKVIDDFAFSNCSSLTEIILPEGLTTIGFLAFDGCRSLKRIVLPSTVKSIGRWGLTPAIESLTCRGDLPEGDGIDANSFFLARNLVDEDGFIIVGKTVLGYDSEKNPIAIIPNSAKKIIRGAFQGSNLTEIIIPENIVSIPSGTFYDCKNLGRLTLSKSMSIIEESAFERCPKLSVIRLADPMLLHAPSDTTSKIIGVTSCLLLVQNDSSLECYAFSVRTTSSKYDGNTGYLSCYDEFIVNDDWAGYDAEIINNGPVYKYKLMPRLLAALSRLTHPVKLTEENKTKYLELLIKNAKKMIPFAEELKCPEIIRMMVDTGVINDVNRKAIAKVIATSNDPVIAAITL